MTQPLSNIFLPKYNSTDLISSEEQSTENFESEKQKLLELAEAGKLTKEEFENSPIAQTIFKDTGLSAEQATQEINKAQKNKKTAVITDMTIINISFFIKK